jgi:hypothetical protein
VKALALTKAQAVALCLTAAMIPVAWQWNRLHKLSIANSQLEARLAAESITMPPAPPPIPAATRNLPAIDASGSGSKPAVAGKPVDRRDDKRGHPGKLFEQLKRESWLAALREQVGLDDAQLSAAAQTMEAAESRRRELVENARKAGETPAAAALADISRDQEAAMTALLDDDQLAAYGELVRQDERSQQELYANKMLGPIQSILHLSDAQKDQLFAVFVAQAAAADADGAPLPDRPIGDEQIAQLKGILTDEQFRIWQQQLDIWTQFFRPRGPRR